MTIFLKKHNWKYLFSKKDGKRPQRFMRILLFILLLFSIMAILTLGHTPNAMAQKDANGFSTALPLHNHCHVKKGIPAYDSLIFYVESAGTLCIQSTIHHAVSVTLYDQSGTKLHRITLGKKDTLSISKKYFTSSSRIFIQCSNRKTKDTAITLFYSTTTDKKCPAAKSPKNTSKPQTNKPPLKSEHKHISISKKKRAKTKKKTSENTKLSTNDTKNVSLNPHFITAIVHSNRKFSIRCGKQKLHPDDFLWISSNPSIATLHGQTINAHKEGTVIFFGTPKKKSLKNCSLLVRVLNVDQKNAHDIRKGLSQ